jgi:MoxR-like ATPase
VPELGTITARNLPLVILTSNNTREVSDALKRRCLHLFIDFPSQDQELQIVKLKVPGIRDHLASEVATIVQRIRKLDLKKSPSISETLDWARALTLLNVETLGDEVVNERSTRSSSTRATSGRRRASSATSSRVSGRRRRGRAGSRREWQPGRPPLVARS